jgi:two-component system phosphate regulon sensor histidine kinase PhoR
MVNQLLEMSQLETGALVPQFFLVDPGQVVRDATHAFEQRLAQGGFYRHQLVMTFAAEETIPLVQADPRLLRDALDTVLENALNYSPEGGTIEVVMRIRNESSAHATSPSSFIISVQDSGIGIPSGHLDRIFDRFHRVETGLVRAFNGLGLGLAICKRILELHGGSISVESRLGEGSTFHLSLPLSAPVEC